MGRDGLPNVMLRTRRARPSEGWDGHDCCVRSGGVPVTTARRGTFIVPAEVAWMIQPGATDATSGSLRGRRGTLVVPAEAPADPPPFRESQRAVSLQPMTARRPGPDGRHATVHAEIITGLVPGSSADRVKW